MVCKEPLKKRPYIYIYPKMELNHRPKDFQSCALPTELSGFIYIHIDTTKYLKNYYIIINLNYLIYIFNAFESIFFLLITTVSNIGL